MMTSSPTITYIELQKSRKAVNITLKNIKVLFSIVPDKEKTRSEFIYIFFGSVQQWVDGHITFQSMTVHLWY